MFLLYRQAQVLHPFMMSRGDDWTDLEPVMLWVIHWNLAQLFREKNEQCVVLLSSVKKFLHQVASQSWNSGHGQTQTFLQGNVRQKTSLSWTQRTDQRRKKTNFSRKITNCSRTTQQNSASRFVILVKSTARDTCMNNKWQQTKSIFVRISLANLRTASRFVEPSPSSLRQLHAKKILTTPYKVRPKAVNI